MSTTKQVLMIWALAATLVVGTTIWVDHEIENKVQEIKVSSDYCPPLLCPVETPDITMAKDAANIITHYEDEPDNSRLQPAINEKFLRYE